MTMLKNYLTTAFRSLRRRRGYAALNVLGLAVGMACVILIGLYIHGELGYDRFHGNADRIVRMVGDQVVEGETQRYATTQGILAPALAADLPEVERTTRLSFAEPVITVGERRFSEADFLFADSTFFEVFDGYTLLRGDPATVLDGPGHVVLSETLAHTYFGTEEAVGQVLYDRGTPLTVTGVMADVPQRSHLQFGGVMSLSTAEDPGWWYTNWSSFSLFTYVLLRAPEDLGRFRDKLPAFMEQRAGDEMATLGQHLAVHAEPLADVYLRSDRSGGGGGQGSIANLYIFGAVALFVLLIGCVNFTNLATARSTERAKEVGVRKTLGAARGRLAAQFLGEAVVLSAAALIAAVALAQAALPTFEMLTGQTYALLDLGPWLAGLLALGLGTGLLAGAYPALVLSRFEPVRVLKGRFASGRQGTRLRQGLVVLQLGLTIALIAGTAIIATQLRYMRTYDVGFDLQSGGTELLTIDFGGDAEITSSLEAIKQRLLRHPAVEGVTSSMAVPGGMHASAGGAVEQPDGRLRDFSVEAYLVDTAFVGVYGLDVIAGQQPGAPTTTDSAVAYVFNETAVRKAGYARPEDILGQTAGFWGMEGEVVGVVRDFHTRGLQRRVAPLALAAVDAYQSVLTLRVHAAGLPETLRDLEAVWQDAAPHRPFDYRFLDDAFAAQYDAERRFAFVFGALAIVAVLIACLGLFGLAAFTAEQRTKEIGMRKVLGASAPSLVLLLTRDTAVLVGIALAAAVPVVYWAMTRWLEAFPYRVEIGWPVFALAGTLALAVALTTVAGHALRAALADPVDSLRYE